MIPIDPTYTAIYYDRHYDGSAIEAPPVGGMWHQEAINVIAMWYNKGVPGSATNTPGAANLYRRSAVESIPHASGIYQILCVPTGKIYIGSSGDLSVRWADHRKSLKGNRHANRHLQNAWNKYGPEAFQFSIIELVFEVCLIEREQYWLDRLKPFQKRGFNICINAASPLGIKRSAEHRAKLSASARIRMSDPEQRAAVSRVHKGKTNSLRNREAAGSRITAMNKSEAGRLVTVERNARDYIVTSPDGIEYHVHNLTLFCGSRGLSSSAMCRVARGKANHHKGWLCRY